MERLRARAPDRQRRRHRQLPRTSSRPPSARASTRSGRQLSHGARPRIAATAGCTRTSTCAPPPTGTCTTARASRTASGVDLHFQCWADPASSTSTGPRATTRSASRSTCSALGQTGSRFGTGSVPIRPASDRRDSRPADRSQAAARRRSRDELLRRRRRACSTPQVHPGPGGAGARGRARRACGARHGVGRQLRHRRPPARAAGARRRAGRRGHHLRVLLRGLRHHHRPRRRHAGVRRHRPRHLQPRSRRARARDHAAHPRHRARAPLRPAARTWWRSASWPARTGSR